MSLLRRNSSRVAAISLVALAAWLAKEPSYSAQERATLASQFSFQQLPLSSASNAPPRSVRVVQPQLRRIEAWMSSVGAAVALADADGDGLPNDACLVDPRTDSITVRAVPASDRRYAPFLLHTQPLSYNPRTTAPMGCLPGDFDEDGSTDFLTYYWGRTPVLFLRRPAERLGRGAFARRELVQPRERWFTDSITSADIDGDGHTDLIVGNYFPDGARVLDARAADDPRMEMQHSMSRAYNAGRNRIYLSTPTRARGRRSVRYVEAPGALSRDVAYGWTLAAGAQDLNGDLRPEVYFANDFGPDRLLVNRSTPGHVKLVPVTGRRTFLQPASKVLGKDSFKGMGIDFGDLNGDGRPDMVVSNITAEFALQESNFAFIRTRDRLAAGDVAPFVDRSEQLGLARSGWGWDVKLGDFNNDGASEIVQATGFVKGKVDRWPELHELAMGSDELLRFPASWPHFRAGDDLSGHQPNAFFVRGPTGRYVNLARELQLDAPYVTRGVATADVDGDRRLDFAIANQWEQSYLFMNRSPRTGSVLGLRLVLPARERTETTTVLPYPARGLKGRPATGASATVLLPSGRRLVGQVDGGNGHASVRAPELMFGLGNRPPRRLAVKLAWRDASGRVRRATLRLGAGWHTVLLGRR